MHSGPHRICDTSPGAERVRIEIYRRMPVWRKAQLLNDANRTARLLAFSGIRSRHPGEPLARSRRRLLGLVLGEKLATRIYGPPAFGSE